MSIKAEIKIKGDFSELEKMLKAKELKIGFFAEAKYPEGQSVADVARWNEYGTHAIPPRPFMRNAVDKRGGAWLGYLESELKKGTDADLAFNRCGEMVRVDIIQSINQTSTPPNAPATIARKKSSHPLIDTGFLKSSVTYKVSDLK